MASPSVAKSAARPDRLPLFADELEMRALAKMVAEEQAAMQECVEELWEISYLVESVSRLLEHAERIADCECEAECFRDIQGPKVILRDVVERFTKRMVDLDGLKGLSAYLLGCIREDQGGAR